MNGESETNAGSGSSATLAQLRPIALVVIAGTSGCFIWAFHHGDIFLVSTAMILGGSLGLFSGLVAGVSIADTVLTMGAVTGLFEGIVVGFNNFGVVGAIVGGPLGLVTGLIASLPLMALLLFVLCLTVGSGSGNQSKKE